MKRKEIMENRELLPNSKSDKEICNITIAEYVQELLKVVPILPEPLKSDYPSMSYTYESESLSLTSQIFERIRLFKVVQEEETLQYPNRFGISIKFKNDAPENIIGFMWNDKFQIVGNRANMSLSAALNGTGMISNYFIPVSSQERKEFNEKLSKLMELEEYRNKILICPPPDVQNVERWLANEWFEEKNQWTNIYDGTQGGRYEFLIFALQIFNSQYTDLPNYLDFEKEFLKNDKLKGVSYTTTSTV